MYDVVGCGALNNTIHHTLVVFMVGGGRWTTASGTSVWTMDKVDKIIAK